MTIVYKSFICLLMFGNKWDLTFSLVSKKSTNSKVSLLLVQISLWWKPSILQTQKNCAFLAKNFRIGGDAAFVNTSENYNPPTLNCLVVMMHLLTFHKFHICALIKTFFKESDCYKYGNIVQSEDYLREGQIGPDMLMFKTFSFILSLATIQVM